MSAAKRDISKPKHSVFIPSPQKNQDERLQRKQEWEESVRRSPQYCQISFRRIPHELRERLNEIAQEHEVPMEQVGRLFLQEALKAFNRGEISIQPVIERGRLKIFRDWE